MKRKINYLLMIFCVQLLFSCSHKNEIDSFIGEWTSYDRDIKISKQDSIYKIEFLDKSGQMLESYTAHKIVDLLSYRDNKEIGRQISVYIPVDTKKPNDKNGKPILDYTDSLNIRLIVTDDGDYYRKFKAKKEFGLKGFAGKWKTKTRKDVYAIASIDSTSQGIQVTWIGQPDQPRTFIATFQKDLLNIPDFGVDGGLFASYFKDCDCITIGNDKYYRYDENDFKFLGHWTNKEGEIKISKNGDYYLVRTHLYQDYTFDFLAKVNGNDLKQLFDEKLKGATYTTITYLSPGIISDDGGKTKYFNSNKYSNDFDYSSNNSNYANQSSSTATSKSFSGNVGKMKALYFLNWNSDGTISGTYNYPSRPNVTYVLKGKDLGNGRIELTEYTGNNISAQCNLTLNGNCYVGKMNNTDGRVLSMTMCQQ